MRVLGINAVFHDSAAALVIDGRTVAAAEEERFSRRKHGKRPVPFSAWELPEHAITWCLAEGGLTPDDLDAVAYSYDPALVDPTSGGLDPAWEDLRTTYAARAPQFLQTALPGYAGEDFHFVRHHVAHAASAPWRHPGVRTARSPTAPYWLPTAVVRLPRCWRGVSRPQAGHPPCPIIAAFARPVV